MRWENVRDGDRLRQALAYYDQDKPPKPDATANKMGFTVMTFREAQRYALILQDYLNGATNGHRAAWEAAGALGWQQQFGINWSKLEQNNAASAEDEGK